MDRQARKIGKGIIALGILLVMLVIATGSVSANGVCEGDNYNFSCGMEVNESCTLNATMTCSSGHGLQVGADDITIDGAGHVIDGNAPGACGSRAGIYNSKHDNVVIKNIEIKNFCYGIKLEGTTFTGPGTFDDLVVNNTIDNCTVHDNGNASSGKTMGIDVYYGDYCNITNNTVYSNTGEISGGCEDGGMGIRLYGFGSGTEYGHHNVTNNTIYGNRMAGIYSKMSCRYNNVSYNKIYENGEVVANNYFGGGIRLECIQTNNWTVEYNNVTNNTGPGIYVRGKYNNISHNNVVGNKNASSVTTGTGVGVGDGIFFHSVGNHNNITANRFCYNEYYDMYNNSDATNEFDENTCDRSHPDGLCEYRCMHAFEGGVSSKPPTTSNDPNNEFSSSGYDNIEWDDGTYETYVTTSDGNYAAHRFNFSVIWDSSDVNKINVTWNGRGYRGVVGGNDDGVQLYIWNKSKGASGEYEEWGSSTSGNEITLTNETTSNIDDYINEGNTTVVVVQNSAHVTPPPPPEQSSHIETDYVRFKLEVTPDP